MTTSKGPAGLAATGCSFLITIGLALLATLAVIVWTFCSVSAEQRQRRTPTGLRM